MSMQTEADYNLHNGHLNSDPSSESPDQKLDEEELVSAGITDENENRYLLHGRGNGDGYINQEELVQAQEENIVTVDADSQLSMTQEGVYQSNAWNVIWKHDTGGAAPVENPNQFSTDLPETEAPAEGDDAEPASPANQPENDQQLDSEELASAGISGSNENRYLLEGRGNGDGYMNQQELADAQADDIVVVTDELQLEMTENGQFHSNAWNVIQKHDTSVVSGDVTMADQQLDEAELTAAGVTDPIDNAYLREGYGDQNGLVSESELVTAQEAGLIEIDDQSMITLTDTGRFNALAWNAINLHEGTGVNRSPYNDDRQIGKLELMNAGVTDLDQSRFLRHGLGDGNGFLNQEELVQAQIDGLIIVSPDGEIVITPLGMLHVNAWEAMNASDDTVPEYTPTLDMNFIGENAGYSNMVLTYRLDQQNRPTDFAWVMMDTNNPDAGLPMNVYTDDQGNPLLLLIANGANNAMFKDQDLSTMEITVNEEGKLLVNGELYGDHYYFSHSDTDSTDGKQHFRMSEEAGVVTVEIEDLPDLGDEDFNDLTLSFIAPLADAYIAPLADAYETIAETDDEIREEGKQQDAVKRDRDRQLDNHELANAGVTNMNHNLFLRTTVGDGDGYLTQDELVLAQMDGLITIDGDSMIALTEQGRQRANEWLIAQHTQTENSDYNMGDEFYVRRVWEGV